ncbi:MAG TPA: ABC transporter substrate-binding protein [Acetobacteraceae bacterium]|jgi:phospholipid transport system substrate-binding protein|nr:ABC transporter substrate-binding protein [Acetobacteraceae bacterium]
MLNRRNALGLLSALSVGLTVRAQAASAAEAASSFVKTTGDRLVAVVNGAGSLDARRKALMPIIDSTVDVQGVARFCLGRFWRSATAEQQQQYTQLFHGVLVGNIAVKLGDYRGVKFTLGRAQDRDDGELVSTVIERPNNPPATVQWLIANAATDPKIVDVVAEGTSLRVTQREDYASFLTHNNNSIAALIDAMRKQVSENS